MEHVFITSKSWANLGGLPGMCLSARACGAPDITIHGPPGCMQLYEATKGFILLFEFDVNEHRLEDGEFSDGAVSVKSVLLPRSEDSTSSEVKAEWEGLLEVERQEGAIRLLLTKFTSISRLPSLQVPKLCHCLHLFILSKTWAAGC